MAALEYARKKTPGGLSAVLERLDEDERGYLDQIFVAGTDYDVGPLVRMSAHAAALEGSAPDEFVRRRARESADMDIRGIYRLLLRVASPDAMAERLPRAFNRYFSPCSCELVTIRPGSLQAVFNSIPAPLAAWYVAANEGFVGRALEIAGAKNVSFRWLPPVSRPPLQSVLTCALQLDLGWR